MSSIPDPTLRLNNVPSQVQTLLVPEVPRALYEANVGGFVHFWAVLAQVRSHNTPRYQVHGLVRNIIVRVHAYCTGMSRELP
jgi:hypothetical protein